MAVGAAGIENSQIQHDGVPSAPSAGMASAVFNLINAILGAGIVSLPYAWGMAGFLMGWFLFVVTAIITCYTLELLICIGDPLSRRGEIDIVAYEDVVFRILGSWGRLLVLGSQFCYAFGISVGYIVIMHNELPTALGQLSGSGWFDHGGNKILLVLACAFGLLLPMSLMRTVGALAKLSFICFCTAFVLIGIVAYELVEDREELCNDMSGSGSCDYNWTSPGKLSLFKVYGIFIFTKACHHTQFQIYRSLGEKANPKRWGIVVKLGILLCSLITATSSMLVYATFGDGVQSDFFKSYGEHSYYVSVGRLVFACVMMLGFPMQLFVTRETVQVLLTESDEVPINENIRVGEEVPQEVWAEDRQGEKDPMLHGVRRSTRSSSHINRRDSSLIASAAGGAVREDTSTMLHVGTTLALFFVIVGIGISTDQLGVVLDLVGGIAGSIIAFILPGLVGYYSEEVVGIRPPGGRKLAGCTAIFGCTTLLITTVFTFIDV